MKPDASIDCYGLLGVQPNANEDEIKKAFRKQAMIHHPDRNPGREDEAKAEFQDMQAAYDILSTPTKRTRYDQERLRKGMLWQKKTAPTAPTQPPRPSRQNPSQARPPPNPAPGPSRYADYAQTARDSSPFADVNAKFQAFKAFESMKGGSRPANAYKTSPPKSRPPPTAQKSRSRSDWDEGQYADPPRFGRSQSTRVPRRGGFNPYAQDGDDTSSRNTSAYYNVARGERAQASYPFPPENLFQRASASRETGQMPSEHSHNNDDVYNSERQRTPYANKFGEKTYFSSSGLNRSASTATNLHNLYPGQARTSPASRYRSASPRARSPRPPADEETSSSESESAFEEMRTDHLKQSQREFSRRASADPRPSAPKATVQDESEEPLFARPNRQQTWDTDTGPPRTNIFSVPKGSAHSARPTAEKNTSRRARPVLERDSTVPGSAPTANFQRPAASSQTSTNDAGANVPSAGNGKKPSLYGTYPFPSADDFLSPKSVDLPDKVKIATPKSSRFSKSWPFWAIPSSVIPKKPRENDPSLANHLYESDRGNLPGANAGLNHSSFSIPSSSSESTSPLRNPSTENVNTQFSPGDWHGQFFGAPDSVGAQQAPNARSTSRPKSSQPKRRTPGDWPQWRAPDAADTNSPQQVPSGRTSPRPGSSPPKPPTPHTTHMPQHGTAHDLGNTADIGQREAQPSTAQQSATQAPDVKSPTKFSPAEWNKHFQQGTWAMPPPMRPPPTSIRPTATPRSRNAKRGPAIKKPNGTGAFANPAVIFDDTGEEGDDEGRQSGSNLDTEPEMDRNASSNAMDIDSSTPPETRVPSSSNAAGPSPTPESTISPTPSFTNFPKPPPPSTAFNMQPLTSTFPLAGSSSAGLSDMKSDIGATLPFASGDEHGNGTIPQAQQLSLPSPPKTPLPPGRLTNASSSMYMSQVASYMREFHAFNSRMLQHLNARQAAMEQMTQSSATEAEKGFVTMVNGVAGSGFGASGVGGVAGANLSDTASWSWMGARGDEGYLRYMAWMQEDQRVRMHYNVAWDRHREALEKLGEVRHQMKDLVARGLLK